MPGNTSALQRVALAGVLACLVLALLAPAASATFHVMQIREVFFGTAVNGHEDAYVELQMWSAGQNFVQNHPIEFYEDQGASSDPIPLAQNVANGQNQATILIGDDQAAGSPDQLINDMNNFLDEPGGAVCWVDVDCMSWGTGPGPATLPTPVGNPELIPNETMALQRSIAPGCPTALDAADDSDDSAADFSPVTPNPRNNATPPTETLCISGGLADTDPPQTKIKKRPPNRSEDATPKFKFRSDEPGSTFKCKVDGKKYRKCKSPKTLKPLDSGKHKFKVKATDAAGNTDNTPAKDTFKVLES
jgi:hypothetical protein